MNLAMFCETRHDQRGYSTVVSEYDGRHVAALVYQNETDLVLAFTRAELERRGVPRAQGENSQIPVTTIVDRRRPMPCATYCSES